MLAKNLPQAKLTRTVPEGQVGQNRVTCRIRHEKKHNNHSARVALNSGLSGVLNCLEFENFGNVYQILWMEDSATCQMFE